MAGLVLLFASLICLAFYGKIASLGIAEVLLLIIILVCSVVGLALVIAAFVLYFLDIERMDVENYFSADTKNKFNLKTLYNEYYEKKYSTWRDNLLRNYNTTDKDEKKKRIITDDMQHYLRMIKRKLTLADTVLTTIVAPAEIGIIAVICTSEELGGLIGAFVLTLFICIMFILSLKTNYKVRCFVDDLADILKIPMDGNN